MEAGGREFGGAIVGRVFSPTRQLVRFSHPNMPFFANSEQPSGDLEAVVDELSLFSVSVYSITAGM